MSQINVTVDAIPHDARIYQFALADEPGTVAAKNFFSWFNPAGSGKIVSPLGLVVQPYSAGNSVASNSMTLFRTSADSGGTLVSASTITKFNPSDATNPVSTIRKDNPAATTTGLVLLGIAPVETNGGGAALPAIVAPFGLPPFIPAGTGLVFGTAAGAASQLWNIQLTWWEYTP